MPEYRFRSGARVSGVTPEVVTSELARIHQENDDTLTAPAVVSAAKPATAPLHPAFEWRNSVAADEYRLIQARQLIRAVIVIPEKVEGEQGAPASPAWVHVEKDNYQPIEVVVQRPDLFEMALKEAQSKLAAAERAVMDLKRAAEHAPNPDRMAAIGLAVQGFAAVKEALAVIR